MNKFPIISDSMKEFRVKSKRLESFLTFVKEQHGDQKRKYTGEPYWFHVLYVATIVQHKIHDPGLLIEVALGHDLYEDTKCGSCDLNSFMRLNGYQPEEVRFVDNGILALTDMFTTKLYPEMNRKTRKDLETKRLGDILSGYQSVKYADLIHNTQSIVQHDPSFALVYLQEKNVLLKRMKFGDIDLHREAFDTLNRAYKFLKEGGDDEKCPGRQ